MTVSGLAGVFEGGWIMGIISAILALLVLKFLKSALGYYDLKKIGATKYRNHYISLKAPNNVRVIRTKRASS